MGKRKAAEFGTESILQSHSDFARKLLENCWTEFFWTADSGAGPATGNFARSWFQLYRIKISLTDIMQKFIILNSYYSRVTNYKCDSINMGSSMSSCIWRYVDFVTFMHLITTQTLHFTRVDRFSDKFEGSYPKQNLEEWSVYPEIGNFKFYRKSVCVSCWYESDRESAAMWERYGTHGGLAICSTKERLQKSLQGEGVHFKHVSYIDFISEKADIGSPYEIFTYKRIEFGHDNEFRALVDMVPQSTEKYANGFPKFGNVEVQAGYPDDGFYIDIDISSMIDRIVLSPYTKKYVKTMVTDILKTYKLDNLAVNDSQLASDPIYPNQ